MQPNKFQKGRDRLLKVNLKSEWGIYSWCLLLAFILWLLTGLSDTYVTQVVVRANYTNIPKDKVYVHPLPDELKIQVQASGWDLFTLWITGNKEKINIDMSQYSKKSFIATNTRLKEELKTRLAHKMNILEIDPDTIYLSRETRMSRRIPVVMKVNINCEKEYGISDKVKIVPEFVTISGPQSLVRQIQFIETRDTMIDDLDKSGEFKVNLKQPSYANLSIDTSQVIIQIPVEELIETKVNIPVSIINSKGRNYRTEPAKVTVLYQVTKNREKRTRTSLFEAVADASKSYSTGNDEIKIRLVNHPDYTYNFRFKPETIKLIRK